MPETRRRLLRHVAGLRRRHAQDARDATNASDARARNADEVREREDAQDAAVSARRRLDEDRQP